MSTVYDKTRLIEIVVSNRLSICFSNILIHCYLFYYTINIQLILPPLFRKELIYLQDICFKPLSFYIPDFGRYDFLFTLPNFILECRHTSLSIYILLRTIFCVLYALMVVLYYTSIEY